PVCLICSQTVALIKSGNVKRHYETKHKGFEQTYPLKSENVVAETLLDGKPKQELCDKIKQIPMSASSATKKGEILTEDVLTQLDEAIHKAPCVGLAVDESTHICDNAQVRCFNTDQKAFCEDLLGVTPLQTSTRGEDVYLAIEEMLTKRGIEHKVSIATDGAPAMIGREKGAVARLKEDNPELSLHCIIHQSVLCASLSDEHAEVMNTMMKMINFLRASSSTQHRMLREFLREVDANADDLLLHNNVRWLSKGKVLARFRSIRREVASFLAKLRHQKATQFSLFLGNEKQMDNVAFLVDITAHLNELNFKDDLQGDCAHFPAVQEQVQGQRDGSSFVDFIDKLIVNFSNRFDSFSFGQQLTMFIQNPFIITDVRGFSEEVTQHFKWVNPGPLQMQLVDLQADVSLREQFLRTDPSTFWLQTVPETAFPGLRKVAIYILTMFGSTYNREAAFSTMNIIKNKYGSRLTNEHLHMCMRMAL
uniref:HAT C-terminal dimerisation domain-containing protein n=1 Tax=Gasterosteus aculeatus TaxID=69293 RepID=G3NA36_GASAC